MSITYYLLVGLVTVLINPICHVKASKKPDKNCPNRCGDVKIEYPFGIGLRCSYDGNYTIFCNRSTTPKPKPFLTILNREVIAIHPSDVTVSMPAYNSCTPASDRSQYENVWNNFNLTGTAFTLAGSHKFASIGCRGMATLHAGDGSIIAACSSNCDTTTVGCYGYICCQSYIQYYEYQYYEYLNNYSIRTSTTPGSCRVAFVSTFDFVDNLNATNHSSIARVFSAPIMLHYDYDYIGKRSLGEVVWDVIRIYYILPVTAIGALLLSCCCFGSCWYCRTKKTRMEIRLRAKYFLSRLEETSNNKVVENTKLVTIRELKKATDNFHRDRVLGEGGQGTVYKGMLANGKVIAAKRSKTFEETEWKQFINEVILLSQVNHKNVVKLLGCCLETKPPMIVYEYIPSGTLRQHINDSNKDCPLSWKMRVRIATQAAGAIAYLHSYSSTPIYHRDIKTTNILLDDKFQAKVSDFGISKAIIPDKTHMTTCVRGTFGYLDPEYFRSGRFTEKSDVYSFGVVLVELLTGQQPIRFTDLDGEQSLVLYFINSMNRGSLDEILDPIVLEESKKEETMIMANLAKKCLKPRGIQRPTMKEVAMELESLLKDSSSDLSSFEPENCEMEPTLDMNKPHTCPVIHNRATDTEYNVHDELPLFGADTM